MEILITNDDGIQARGIQTLAKLMCEFGHVTVVAPTEAQSGKSNAISISNPVRLTKVMETEQMVQYACSGTPSDCVKLGVTEVLNERKPDLVVSGINHGSNASISVIYSGTMGATFVAAENGIPAIGFSLCDHSPEADFSYFEPYIRKIVQAIMQQDTPYGVVYNVNAPVGQLKGIKVTRQAEGHWGKEWKRYEDPNGRPFYMMTGTYFIHEPESRDTDEYMLQHGYVSITPQKVDMTDFHMLKALETVDW